MVFSSCAFIFYFLPIILALVWMGPRDSSHYAVKYRNAVLMCASIVFYAWGEPHFVLLLCIYAYFNYLLAKKIYYQKKNYLFILV